MVNPKHIYICLSAILLTTISLVNAQQITVDTNVTVQELIENNLVEGCAAVSNITSTRNGSIVNLNSFGTFSKAGSNFPFENGIVISTGDAASAGNTVNDDDLNEGNLTWTTDPDLEALGITNTHNATSIEFDFVSVTNTLAFNYILASEEYLQNEYICNNQDSFVFLIREDGATTYTNIAVVPGTSTVVSPGSIHPEIFGFCEAENNAYFDDYDLGDTNFDARTTVLTAATTIVPNTTYNIKLIIADGFDQNFDSAVFIEGNALMPSIDLGDDFSTCSDMVTLNGNIDNNLATYTWFLDGTEITGENTPQLNVTQSGTYKLEISIPLNGTPCIIEDEITITLSSEQSASPIADYQICDPDGDGIETFDLTTQNSAVLNSVPSGFNYDISYHLNQDDAENNVSPITAPIQNNSNQQTIYVRVIDTDSGCLAYPTIDLVVNPLPTIIAPNPFVLCDDDVIDGFTQFDLSQLNNGITSNNPDLIVTYHETQTNAENGIGAVGIPYTNTATPAQTLYIRVTDRNTGCATTTSVNIRVNENPLISQENIFIDGCDSDHDGFTNFDLTSINDDILQGLTNVTVTFYEAFEDSQSGTNPITNDTDYTNTVFQEQVVYVRVEDNTTGCYTLRTIEIHANLLLSETRIETYRLCDAENDGEEEFNLNAVSIYIANELEDITVTYYETEDDMNAGTNPIDPTDPYLVTESPKTLFIKIESPTCTEYDDIELEIRPTTTFDDIGVQNVCDENQDGFTTIDLSQFDSLLYDGNSGFIVRYYASQEDASANENELDIMFSNTTNPQTIYTNIVATGTGCRQINSFNINVLPAPIATAPTNILICDNDDDGFFIVNLDSKKPEIADPTSHTISFYNTAQDAIDNANEITDSAAYNADTQTIYTRVVNNTTGCTAYTSFQVTVNTLPVVGTIENYQICQAGNSSTADFIFSTQDAAILNGQPGKQVLYFETANDAINRTNAIDKFAVYNNSMSPQTIHIRIENTTDQDCYVTDQLTILVAPSPIYNTPTPLTICDDITNDGEAIFNFNDVITQMSAGSPQNLTITFYASQADAQNEVNPLPTDGYANVSNPQEVYVRVENDSFCSEIELLGLNIIPVPEVSTANPIITCDDNYDGVVTVDLTTSGFEIFDVRDTNIVAAYYRNLNDVENQVNEITTPEAFTTSGTSQTAYLRVGNTVTLCYVAIPIEITVNLPPEFTNTTQYTICDNETNSYNLNTFNNIILNDTTGISISYHANMADATANQNPLAPDYTYTTFNDTIAVRAIYNDTNCVAYTTVTLNVNPLPNIVTPPNLETCDDDYDGIMPFNLGTQSNTILNGLPTANYSVDYFLTNEDAQANTNAIGDLNVLATTDQEFFVRVTNNSTQCFATTTFKTIVHRKPILDIGDQVICLENFPLVVSADTGFATDTYQWSNNVSSDSTLSEVDITTVGSYSVTITTENGCSTSTTFNVTESEQATIEFTETVDFSDPNNITITVSGIGDYVFALDNGPYQEDNVFYNVTLGPHIIRVKDLNGCTEVSREVVVIDVPLFVTPNGDGYNDTWHITGVEQLTGTIVYIFDRYGKLLKTLLHNSLGWDGTYNGQPMPANDYWYTAKVKKDGIEFDVQGHFTLKR